MHGATVARSPSDARALLPRAAGAFCAMDTLQSDVWQDYLQILQTSTRLIAQHSNRPKP